MCAQLLMREWSRKRKGCSSDVISPPVPGSHPLVNHASLFTAPLLRQKQYPLSRNHPWNRRLHTCPGPWGTGAKGCVITATNGVAGVHLLWKTNIRFCALYIKLHMPKNIRHLSFIYSLLRKIIFSKFYLDVRVLWKQLWWYLHRFLFAR